MKQKKKQKVVICSHHISYNMGGVATITRLTADELLRQGYEVVILTNCDDGKFRPKGCRIFLNPSPWCCLKQIVLSDYVICEGAIVRLCWPLLVVPKKSIVVRHMPITQRLSLLRRCVEKWLSLNAVWAGVSKYVAEREYIKMAIVPNARDHRIFYDDNRQKKFDLIFVGGINRIKGADILFEAVERLIDDGIKINRLTFVGEGDLHDALKHRLTNGRIGQCDVVFTGNLDSWGVAEMLRNHRCMIAPTNEELFAEAFPCVCLEGAACGCTIISSNSGGMSESMGPSGITFDSRNIDALCGAIKKVLCDGWQPSRSAVAEHLSHYTPESLVNAYFQLMGK